MVKCCVTPLVCGHKYCIGSLRILGKNHDGLWRESYWWIRYATQESFLLLLRIRYDMVFLVLVSNTNNSIYGIVAILLAMNPSQIWQTTSVKLLNISWSSTIIIYHTSKWSGDIIVSCQSCLPSVTHHLLYKWWEGSMINERAPNGLFSNLAHT